MLTRREALVGAAAGGSLVRAARILTSVNFDVPANACDCHTHIFGDPKIFPLWGGRTYTPELALPKDMAALHRALHIERVVIVTPSVYGADNSATLYGMKARGKSARGIAVIGDETTDRDLDAMHRAGVRGIRLNLATDQIDPAVARRHIQTAITRTARRAWHIQIYSNPALISGIKDLVREAPVPVVFDHFGGAQASLGLEQPGFADLLELVRSAKAYVKISGAYRASNRAPAYPDVAPFARALVAAHAERVVWGTDWPHPDSSARAGRTTLAPPLPIDDGMLLNQLAVWVPDPDVRKKILVDNPARLYGF